MLGLAPSAGGVMMRLRLRPLAVAVRRHLVVGMFAVTLLAPGAGHAAKRAFYVWNRQWREPVRTAVGRALPLSDTLFILAAEMKLDRGATPDVYCVPVAWSVLKGHDEKLCAVFRFGTGIASALAGENWLAAVEFSAGLWHKVRNEADSQGVKLSALQIDLDCPTAELGAYRRFLARLASEADVPVLSLTALPCWLDSAQFAALLKCVDHYVLQVHSLDKPETINDRAHLYRRQLFPGWLRQADALAKPYFVALPTFGYRLFFAPDGRFVGLSAEGGSVRWQPGLQQRLLMASPDELAMVVKELAATPRPHLLGVAWFRLPVDTDQLNWSWQALRAVMRGNAPRVDFDARVESRGNGLFDLTVCNQGERNVIGGRIRVSISWSGASIQGHDTSADYHLAPSPERDTVDILGPAPALEVPRFVGWFRLDSGGTDSEAQLRIVNVRLEE